MKNKYVVEVECENPNCKKIFKKQRGEYNRSIRLGRKQYCSLCCYGKHSAFHAFDGVPEKKKKELQENIKNYCASNRDSYTNFRFFLKVAKDREKLGDKYKIFDQTEKIDLVYLKELWDSQKGICPLSGCFLVLPDNCTGWKNERDWKRASLDRIDSSKGYVKGNVRFISWVANIARSNMSDEKLIEFCKAVTENKK